MDVSAGNNVLFGGGHVRMGDLLLANWFWDSSPRARASASSVAAAFLAWRAPQATVACTPHMSPTLLSTCVDVGLQCTIFRTDLTNTALPRVRSPNLESVCVRMRRVNYPTTQLETSKSPIQRHIC